MGDCTGDGRAVVEPFVQPFVQLFVEMMQSRGCVRGGCVRVVVYVWYTHVTVSAQSSVHGSP